MLSFCRFFALGLLYQSHGQHFNAIQVTIQHNDSSPCLKLIPSPPGRQTASYNSGFVSADVGVDS